VAVHRELRQVVLAHQLLQVRPDAVGALSEHVVALVEHLVQDLDALVRHPDLVGVRVHQRPPHRDGLPVLDDRVELAAYILDGLFDQRKQRLEFGIHRAHGHRYRVPTTSSARATAPAAVSR
jgi:hypothetical protein